MPNIWVKGNTDTDTGLIQLRFLRPIQDNIGHFGNVLPSQSLGLVLKKLNLTQQIKQTSGESNLT